MLRYDGVQRFHFWPECRAFLLGEMEQEGEEQESEGEDNHGSDSHEMERALDEALAQQPDKEDQRVVESNLLVSDGHDEEEGAHAVPVQ